MDPEERLSQIEDAIRSLAEVFGQLCEKVSAMDEELDQVLESKVTDRLGAIEKDFGGMVEGFNGILDGRRKSRYSEMLGGNADLQKYAPKYEKVFKHKLVDDAVENIMSYLEQEGADESGIPDVINQILSDLRDRFDEEQAEGEGAAHEAAESPEEEKAEHLPGASEEPVIEKTEVKVEAPADDGMEKIKEMARGLKGRKPY